MLGNFADNQEIFSIEPIYFKLTGSSEKYNQKFEGLKNVSSYRKCIFPYVFHAMLDYPEGKFIKTRAMRGLKTASFGHEDLVFSYMYPRNNIVGNNNIISDEREEMKILEGDNFYNLVFQTKRNVQKVIRLGSLRKSGYLTVLEGKNFYEITRLGIIGICWFYSVYQTVSKKPAKIIEVVKIDGRNAHRRYGFYHLEDFEYVKDLVGTIPLEEYLSRCSKKMQRKLNKVANMIEEQEPLPLPSALNRFVKKNRDIDKSFLKM